MLCDVFYLRILTCVVCNSHKIFSSQFKHIKIVSLSLDDQARLVLVALAEDCPNLKTFSEICIFGVGVIRVHAALFNFFQILKSWYCPIFEGWNQTHRVVVHNKLFVKCLMMYLPRIQTALHFKYKSMELLGIKCHQYATDQKTGRFFT